MKKKKIFWAGIILIVIGVAFGIHANLSTYMDNEGVIHENFSTPLSAFFTMIGFILLIIGLAVYFFKKR